MKLTLALVWILVAVLLGALFVSMYGCVTAGTKADKRDTEAELAASERKRMQLAEELAIARTTPGATAESVLPLQKELLSKDREVKALEDNLAAVNRQAEKEKDESLESLLAIAASLAPLVLGFLTPRGVS